jgi:hypothetical protein
VYVDDSFSYQHVYAHTCELLQLQQRPRFPPLRSTSWPAEKREVLQLLRQMLLQQYSFLFTVGYNCQGLQLL